MSRVWRILCAGVWLGLLGGGAEAAEPAPRVPVAPTLYEGAPLALVYLDLRDAAGVELVDDPLRSEILSAFGLRAGSPFSMAGADLGLQQVRRVPSVADASWALYESSRAGEPVLALVVKIDASAGPAKKKGWLLTGKARDFPTFLETDRALLRAQVNGGLGWYNDHNAWWGHPEDFVAGSPLFPDPAEPGWASWGEASVEMGLHGAVQLGSRRIFAFGNVTGVGAGSAGQDPWRSDARFEVELEKAYGGFLVAPKGKDMGLSVSYGRQTWQLNKGFLFSQYAGSFNAAQWGASYIAARTALERAFLAKLRWSKVSLEAFLVDPQEYFLNDSDTRYRGLNLQWKDADRLELGAVYYTVPRSSSTFVLPDGSRVPREGLRTANLRLATRRLGGVDGLQLESELAHQTNENYDMSADAWYVSLGYEATARPWRPSLTYRYAFFEGDDPSTSTFERFDAPQSSGSDTWLQGNIFKKTVVNSNLKSHRVRLAVAPTKRLGLVLNYFYLWADEYNNRGGARPLQELTSRDFGQELDLHVNWSISRRLFFLGFAGIARPGSGDRRGPGGRRADMVQRAGLSLLELLSGTSGHGHPRRGRAALPGQPLRRALSPHAGPGRPAADRPGPAAGTVHPDRHP